MKINIKGTNLSITPEISEYLNKRLQAVEKFLPKDGGAFIADAELGRTTQHHQTGDIFRAEINMHIGGKSFRAVSEGQDLFFAIDNVKDEITRILGADKEKRISLIRRGGQKVKAIIRGLYPWK